jgi:hypothetical protein
VNLKEFTERGGVISRISGHWKKCFQPLEKQAGRMLCFYGRWNNILSILKSCPGIFHPLHCLGSLSELLLRSTRAGGQKSICVIWNK